MDASPARVPTWGISQRKVASSDDWSLSLMFVLYGKPAKQDEAITEQSGRLGMLYNQYERKNRVFNDALKMHQ